MLKRHNKRKWWHWTWIFIYFLWYNFCSPLDLKKQNDRLSLCINDYHVKTNHAMRLRRHQRQLNEKTLFVNLHYCADIDQYSYSRWIYINIPKLRCSSVQNYWNNQLPTIFFVTRIEDTLNPTGKLFLY